MIVWMSVGAVPGTLLEGQNGNSARILNWAARRLQAKRGSDHGWTDDTIKVSAEVGTRAKRGHAVVAVVPRPDRIMSRRRWQKRQ